MPSEAVISFSRPATSIWSCSDSTTHGPEMRKKGRSSPTSNPQSFMLPPTGNSPSCRHGLSAARPALGLVLQRRLDVRLEERVAAPRRGLELGVELHAHEPRVHRAGQLHDLGELLALRERRDDEAGVLQL